MEEKIDPASRKRKLVLSSEQGEIKLGVSIEWCFTFNCNISMIVEIGDQRKNHDKHKNFVINILWAICLGCFLYQNFKSGDQTLLFKKSKYPPKKNIVSVHN